MFPIIPIIGGFIATLFIAAVWDDVKDWLLEWVPKLYKSLVQTLEEEKIECFSGVFIDALKDGAARIYHSVFYKKNGKIMRESVATEISEDELPDSLREKFKKSKQTNKEMDITPEIVKENPELEMMLDV